MSGSETTPGAPETGSPTPPPGRGPRWRVLPRLGPLPRGMWVVWLLLLIPAWILLLPASAAPWAYYPAGPAWSDGTEAVNFHWQFQQLGLSGLSQADYLFYPQGKDYLAQYGFPLNALVGLPLFALFGWPAGFTIFVVLCLWGVGVSMAWLAGQWWRSRAAALVAGVVLQSGSALLLEVAEGRVANLFGAIFFPLALGFICRAMVTDNPRQGLAAGIATGLSALSYWFYGLFLAITFGVALLVSLVERRLPWRAFLAAAIATLVLAGGPAYYAFTHLSQVPFGEFTQTDKITMGGSTEAIPIVAWIFKYHTLTNFAEKQPWSLVRPLLFVLMILALPRRPVRRYLLPLALVGTGVLFAFGPGVPLPGGTILPGPFLALNHFPGVRRFWWPSRMLILAEPAMALLAAGGALTVIRFLAARTWKGRVARLATSPWTVAVILAGLLLTVAIIRTPFLPLTAVVGTPTPAAKVIAKGKGPLLLLPHISGRFARRRLDLVDQVHHKRRMANGHAFVLSDFVRWAHDNAPTWPAVNYAAQCEVAPELAAREVSPRAVWPALKASGVLEVYLNAEKINNEPAQKEYLRCIEDALGPPHRIEAPFRIYQHAASLRLFKPKDPPPLPGPPTP